MKDFLLFISKGKVERETEASSSEKLFFLINMVLFVLAVSVITSIGLEVFSSHQNTTITQQELKTQLWLSIIYAIATPMGLTLIAYWICPTYLIENKTFLLVVHSLAIFIGILYCLSAKDWTGIVPFLSGYITTLSALYIRNRLSTKYAAFFLFIISLPSLIILGYKYIQL